MINKTQKAMLILFVSILILLISTFVFLNQKKFGQLPSGERLAKIEAAPNYKNGSFQNQSHTPDLPEGVGYWDLIKKFFFEKKIDQRPKQSIPSIKTDLLSLNSQEEMLVWFGHSSYFMQIDGLKILVDPVFCGSASPLPFGTKAFEGTDIYTTNDLPDIDVLFISHDHWDHLDYETVVNIQPKVKKVICGLGVGAHFEYWGYPLDKIIETNWGDKTALADSVIVYTLPARHFSGRGIRRNKSLWASFALQTASKRIYIGGDSGYDTHFAAIGETFGPFDLAILENGQYDEHWPYIHLLPREVLTAAKQLKAQSILPVHSSKFVLGNHPWYEPLESIVKNNVENLNILTPMIGEKVDINKLNQTFNYWWRNLNE